MHAENEQARNFYIKKAIDGNCLIKELSIKLTNDLGRGFDERELRRMRQFYSIFPNRDTLCPELSWSHYRLLIRIDDYATRDFYKNETIKCTWSVRQLEREINTFSYKRYLASHGDYDVVNDAATNFILHFQNGTHCVPN